jgi:hypothetical protein
MSVGGTDFMRHAFLRFAAQSCIVVIFFLFLISSNALAQGSNPFFAPPTFPGVGQALSADVNGDGKIDLVGYTWDAGGLSMIVLWGTATEVLERRLPTPSTPRGIV